MTDQNDSGDDISAVDRLAQLNSFLSTSLFSTTDQARAGLDTLRKDVKNASTGEKDDSEGASTVAFRLFSSQLGPTTIVLREAERPWPRVADPRIRDVADESKSDYAARQRQIRATVVEGFHVRSAQVPWEPMFAKKVVCRRVLRAPNRAPESWPRLAYFDYRPSTNARLSIVDDRQSGSLDERTLGASGASAAKSALKTKPTRPRLLVKNRLLVRPILKEEQGLRKHIKLPRMRRTAPTSPHSTWTPMGRKRINKKRRAAKAKRAK